MADIFAPKTSFNIGYERVVSQPVEDKRGETQAKFQAMANQVQASAIRAQTQVERAKMGAENAMIQGYGNLAISALKFGAGYGRQYQKGVISGAAGEWLDSMVKAQDLRDQGQVNEASMFERKSTRAAVGAGVDLDKYKTEYEAITGRPMEYVGQTREQQVFEMMKSDKNYQMAYLAAQGTLGPNASEEQLTSAALASIQKQAIATNTLALVGAGNQLDWETQVKGAYNTTLDQFDQGIVAGLISRTQKGQPITPGEIDTVLLQHNLMSQKLIKPAYVSDEQWNSVKQRLDLQKEFLTTLKAARDPDNLLTDIVSQMMQSAESPEDAMAVAAASDPSNLAATLGVNIPEVMNKVSSTAFTDNNFKNRGKILNDLQEVDVTQPVSGNSTFTIDTAPSFLKDHVNDDPKAMQRNVEAGLEMIKNLKPMELQGEGAIKQFYNATMSMAAGMLSDKQFYSSATMSKVFNNPNLEQALGMVAAVDREAADEIRISLRSVANLQRRALQANLQSMESALVGAVWDEQDQTYYITGDQGKFLNRPNSTISGEMTDKGFKISDTSVTFPEGYKEAIDRRKSLTILDRAINNLSVQGVEEETTTTQTQSVEGITYKLPEDVQADTEFLNEVARVANEVGVLPDQLLAVIDFETIGSFSPSEKSGTSSGTGLIQFLERTAKGLGTTTSELSQMSRADQMEYVGKYLNRYEGDIKNTGDLYMAVHWPNGIGQSDDYVLYRKGSKAYRANSSLDTSKDGTVTRGEALVRLRDVTSAKFTDVQQVAESAINNSTVQPQPRPAPITESLIPEPRPELANATQAPWYTEEVGEKFAKSIKDSTGQTLNLSDILYFATEEEAQAAVDSGRLQSGEFVIIGTKYVEVE
mgnify:CR=1 FL=1|tara:strand:- start:15824 stop:18436 length:2613 start_codon:yes stop_codon:yes gene_type:complete